MGKELKDLLVTKVKELARQIDGEVEESLGVTILRIKGDYVLKALRAASEFSETPCDFLNDLTVLDLSDQFQVVYQLFDETNTLWLRIKASISRENPVIDSATSLWLGADYPEREAFDMFGVIFRGHPNLKRIYMWDDFEGYPMRKDYITESLEERSIMRAQKVGE